MQKEGKDLRELLFKLGKTKERLLSKLCKRWKIFLKDEGGQCFKSWEFEFKKKCSNLQTTYLFFPDQSYSILFYSCTVFEVLGR